MPSLAHRRALLLIVAGTHGVTFRPLSAHHMAAAALLMALVAVAASAVPARRASAVNPMESLRTE